MTKTPAHEATFKLGDITVKGVHTPCHTQDSICFYLEDGTGRAVFTGDTLFISGGCCHVGRQCTWLTKCRLRQILRGQRRRDARGTQQEACISSRRHGRLREFLLFALPDADQGEPGHEYTKSNVKFAVSVLASEPIKKLQAFADSNKVTTGKFTIGDEKASPPPASRDHELTRYSNTICLCA